MKATELRIGNYVSYQTKESKDIPIGEPHQIVADDFIHLWIEFYLPIPLTEQWLKDFGWKKKKGYWYDKDEECRVHFYTTHEVTTCILEMHYVEFENDEKLSSEWIFIKESLYVHQLQNLYFALTGKELNK